MNKRPMPDANASDDLLPSQFKTARKYSISIADFNIEPLDDSKLFIKKEIILKDSIDFSKPPVYKNIPNALSFSLGNSKDTEFDLPVPFLPEPTFVNIKELERQLTIPVIKTYEADPIKTQEIETELKESKTEINQNNVITDDRSQLKQDTKEVNQIVKQEIKNEVREIRPENKIDLKEEAKETKKEIKEKNKENVKVKEVQEIVPIPKPEVKKETKVQEIVKQEIKKTSTREMSPEVKKETKPELKPVIKQEIKSENNSNIELKREESKPVIKQENKQEQKKELWQLSRQWTKHEFKEAVPEVVKETPKTNKPDSAQSGQKGRGLYSLRPQTGRLVIPSPYSVKVSPELYEQTLNQFQSSSREVLDELEDDHKKKSLRKKKIAICIILLVVMFVIYFIIIVVAVVVTNANKNSASATTTKSTGT